MSKPSIAVLFLGIGLWLSPLLGVAGVWAAEMAQRWDMRRWR